MKFIITFLFILGSAFLFQGNAQISGTKTIPSSSYPAVKVAVDSINTYGVGAGGVFFWVTDGHYERSSISTISNTSSSNSITFKRTGGGNRPIITA